MKTIIIMGGNDVSYNIGKIKKKNFRVIFIFRKKEFIFIF